MAKQEYFDLEGARKALSWLKKAIKDLEALSSEGEKAMEKYDLDSADAITIRIHEIIEQIQERGIIMRDRDGGLYDFPAVINNMPAYLCWTTAEDGIQFWHYADEGFAGRKELTGNENFLSYL